MISEILGNADTPIMINSFSLIILFIFFFTGQPRKHGARTRQLTYFHYIVILNILLLLADSANWLVEGNPAPAMRAIQVTATTLYYLLDPLPSYFFIRFVDIGLNVPLEKQMRLRNWYLVPVMLHVVMALITPFTGWFFRIDALNVYHRGSLLSVSFFLSFILMIIAAAKVLYRYVRAGKQNTDLAKNVIQYNALLKFTVIPLIGGVIQILDYSVTYVWNATVIALLLLYINSQNTEITTDTLTGVFNRRQAFVYFERFVRERERGGENGTVAVVVLDIDSFKSINDHFGHTSGDEAIIAVARSLETEFSWDDFICRFGGDEFLVITKHGQVKELLSAINRVNSNLAQLFKQKKLLFPLSVSAGYSMLSKKNKTLDQLFQKADTMMFEQKAKLCRRIGDR